MEKPLVALKVFSPIPATIWDVKEAKMDIQSAAQVLTPHTVVSLPKIFWSLKEYIKGYKTLNFLTP